MIDEAKPSAVQPAANDQDRASMNALVLPPTVGPMHPLRNALIGKAANAAAGACRIAGRVWTALFRREKPSGDSGSIVAAEFADRLARVEGLLKARDRSVAFTSHELRTPLNGILGMADLLAKTPLTPEQSTYVEAIATSSTALLGLVNDMLDAGKLEAGRWQLRPRPMSPEALVEEVIELLAPKAQAKGLELAAHVAVHVPERVEADPDQLVRILMNLTGNAIKFTDVGGVAIDVSVEGRTDCAVTLAFRVRDSGIGIAPEHHDRIFQDYEQADSGLSGRQVGTGLGLAIAREIARAMGGDITLDSAADVGSVFCLTLTVPIVAATATHLRPFLGRHILLVSNAQIEPPVLMRRLFDLGASVELTRTIEAARSRLGTGSVDMILFDQGKGLDAAQLCNEAGGLPMPMAVMIAPADRHDLERLRAAGTDAHLVKPMRTASLVMVISALLAGETIAGPARIDPTEPQAPPAPALKVLLADDNHINRLLGQSVLKSLGHVVESAENGREAIARVTEAMVLEQPYDVILMDLHMPEIDGFEAIAAIRALETRSDHHVMIIALTADATAESSRRALQSGADHSMTKPIEQDVLKTILASRPSIAATGQRLAHRRQALDQADFR